MSLHPVVVGASFGKTRDIIILGGDVFIDSRSFFLGLDRDRVNLLGAIGSGAVDVHLVNDHAFAALGGGDGDLLILIGLTVQDNGVDIIGSHRDVGHAGSTRDPDGHIGVAAVGLDRGDKSHLAATLGHVHSGRAGR